MATDQDRLEPVWKRILAILGSAGLALAMLGALVLAAHGSAGDSAGTPVPYVDPPALEGYEFVRALGGSLIPNEPVAMVDGADDALYVADPALGRVLALSDLDGSLIDEWGSGGLSEPLGEPVRLTLGPDQRLYVVDQRGDRVVILDSNGRVAGGWDLVVPNPDSNDPPTGIVVKLDGSVHVSWKAAGRVDHYSPEGVLQDSWVLDQGEVVGLALLPDGRLVAGWQVAGVPGGYVLEGEQPEIDHHSRPRGTPPSLISITTDIDGFIYLLFSTGEPESAEEPDNVWYVLKIDPTIPETSEQTGIVTRWVDVLQTPGAADFLPGWSPALGVNERGDVFIPDAERSRVVILRHDGDGLRREVPAPGSQADRFAAIGGLALDAAGNLYLTDPDLRLVRKYGPDGDLLATFDYGAASGWAETGPRIGGWASVAVDPRGQLYVGYSSVTLIVHFDQGGGSSGHWRVIREDGIAPVNPDDISIGTSGDLYVLGFRDPSIRRYTVDGELIGIWPNEIPVTMEEPLDLLIEGDEAWMLSIGETGVTVTRYDLTGNLLEEVAAISAGEFESVGFPVRLARDPEGNLLVYSFVTRALGEPGAFVLKIEPDGTIRRLGPAPLPAWGRTDIVIDSRGMLYLTDPENRQVLVYRPE